MSHNKPTLRIYQSMAMVQLMSDFHFGMSGTSHSYRYDFRNPGVYYVDDISLMSTWHRAPAGPDTSFAAVQKTPFYKRSVKTGSPSTLLSNLIGKLDA